METGARDKSVGKIMYNIASTGNICTNCGKQMIVLKTYSEKVGNSLVTYKDTSCPDFECQKVVNKKLGEEKLKRDKIRDEKEKREVERQDRLLTSRKEKLSRFN